MAKINLLPVEFRSTKENVMTAFNIQGPPLFLLFLSLFFFLAGGSLKIVTLFQNKNLSRLNAQYAQHYQDIEAVVKEKEVVQEKLNKISQEFEFLNSYLKREIVWSEKLSQLRNLIPEEVWLTELSLEKKTAGGSLYIKGGLLPQGKAPPIGTLSLFIKQLKEDGAFFADFDNLILTDFRAEPRKDIEITKFALELSFKK